jgi:hypothetical protein
MDYDIPGKNMIGDVKFGEGKSLVFYHGEHCPYCVNPREEWVKVLKNLSHSDMNTVKIESQEIPMDHEVNSVPTIVLFSGTTKINEFPRDVNMTSENIVEFAKNSQKTKTTQKDAKKKSASKKNLKNNKKSKKSFKKSASKKKQPLKNKSKSNSRAKRN